MNLDRLTAAGSAWAIAPSPPGRSRPRRMRAASALGLAAAAVLVLGASPAAAHGGPATIEVGEAEPAGELTVAFPVRITYEADGHAVEEVGGLTVSGKGPDGAELAPVEAFVPADAPGVFRATVTLPVEGTWELTVDVAEPPGTATLVAEVVGPEAAGPDDGDASVDDGAGHGDPGEAPDAPGEADGAGDGEATTDGEATDGQVGADDAAAVEDAEDDGGVPLFAVVIAVVAAAVAAVAGYRWSTNRS